MSPRQLQDWASSTSFPEDPSSCSKLGKHQTHVVTNTYTHKIKINVPLKYKSIVILYLLIELMLLRTTWN